MRKLDPNVEVHFDWRAVYNGFYVYMLCDDLGEPFYIGKGTKSRWRHHFYPKPLKKHHPRSFKIKKLLREGKKIHVYIDTYSDNDSDACFKREIELISHYRRKCDGGKLTNLTTGGGQDSSWMDDLSEEEYILWRKRVAERNGYADPDLVKKAKLLYHYRGMDGNQISQLEDFQGISAWTIRQWICKNNYNYRYVMPHLKDKTELLEEKREEAKKLYLNSKFTKGQVADILGLDNSFVIRNLSGIVREEQSAGGTT